MSLAINKWETDNFNNGHTQTRFANVTKQDLLREREEPCNSSLHNIRRWWHWKSCFYLLNYYSWKFYKYLIRVWVKTFYFLFQLYSRTEPKRNLCWKNKADHRIFTNHRIHPQHVYSNIKCLKNQSFSSNWDGATPHKKISNFYLQLKLAPFLEKKKQFLI